METCCCILRGKRKGLASPQSGLGLELAGCHGIFNTVYRYLSAVDPLSQSGLGFILARYHEVPDSVYR